MRSGELLNDQALGFQITAPGIRLANKDELFLNVCMLGQQRRTRLVAPYFPLEFYDTLRFEKVTTTANLLTTWLMSAHGLMVVTLFFRRLNAAGIFATW